jgi:WS/DGAT/MGAT family acyltransferase
MAKRVAWAEPLPLHEVKAIGLALGGTINDVLLAAVAGALRAYLVERGEPVDRQLEIRAAVPVNLRPLEQAKNLGNRFGLVLLTLPIGIENPLERLREVHKRMRELRDSYQAIITLGLMEIMGLGPNLAQALAMKMLGRKATAVMTNVAGPQQPLYFAGSQLAELMFWVPQSGSVGMGVSLFSYNDRVHFGLMTDQKLVSDPATIISQFSKEFEQLVLIAMTGPWDKRLDAKAR